MVQKIHDFLIQLGKQGIKLGLENIRLILNTLGNPHHHPRIIHIAGTNGKGSTLITLEQLLLKSGFSTGSTISPHLVHYNERFRINGKSISDEGLIEAFKSVCIACGIDPEIDRALQKTPKIHPTYFEFSMALAFELFRTNKVDYILLETGLGGRLDASNVIDNPIACILTKISLDHMEYLGNSLELITSEKLGILKKGSPLFVSRQEKSVTHQIRKFCHDHQNQIFEFGKEFHFEEDRYHFSSLKNGILEIPEIGLQGSHQKENIATALSVYYSIVPSEAHMEVLSIATCIKELSWNGRLQYLKSHENRFLLDGAHNGDGMDQLINYLIQTHSKDNILFSIGWMKGKNFISQLDTLKKLNITFQPLYNFMEGSESGNKIETCLKGKNSALCKPLKVKELLKQVSTGKLKEFDLIVIAGSLYLIGEFLAQWNTQQNLLEKPTL